MATSGALSTSNQYIKYTIEVIQNSQNVANNTSNVTVKVRFYRTNTGYETYGSGTVYCKINGTTYSAAVTSSQKITNGGIVLFTKTLNIAHNADGTKTLTCSAWIDHSRVTSSEQSYSQTLTTIPRKSTLTVANGTLNAAQTLTVTRQSTSFTHTITYTCGSASGTICTKSTATSISFTPPLSLANQNTTGASVSITYKIETFNGNTSVGSNTYTKTCAIPASVKPTVSVAISEATILKWGVYVQSVSKLSVKITATPAYGSAIASYKTTVDGKAYTTSEFVTEALKGKGSLTITTVVTDKRGRTATYEGTINVLEYTPPSISASVYRCTAEGAKDSQGAYARVKFTTSYASLNNQNELEVKVLYKQKDNPNFETWYLDMPVNGATVETDAFPATTNKSYDIQVIATDAICDLFGKTPPKEVLTLGTISKFLSFFKNVGLGIGKIFDTSKPNTVQVAWDAYFDKDVFVKGLPVRTKRCVCGQNGNSDENPWHKFASVTAKELNEDMRISFKITFAYGSVTRFGTLNAFIRTQHASGANAFQSLIFESDTGLDASNFVMAYSGTGVGAVYELWVKLSAYRFCQFEVLSESSRMAFVDRWTLYDSISLGEAAAPTSGYTQLTATRPATVYAENVENLAGAKVEFPTGIHSAKNIVTDGVTNVIGQVRVNADWIGIYSSADGANNSTGRYCWIGYSGYSPIMMMNEKSTEYFLVVGNGNDVYRFRTWDFYAQQDNTKHLGLSNARWKSVYATTGTVNTSDRNQKKNIADIEQRYIDLFEKLQPVTFEFNYDRSDRVHVGYISQDVKEAMDEVGLTDIEFAGYCRDKKQETNEAGEWFDVLDENGEPIYLYSLRYQEFIALNTKMIQLTRQKVAEQQAEIDTLKSEVKELRAMVEALTKQ